MRRPPKRKRFAEGTRVEASKSKTEIETLLARYGATKFVIGWEGGAAAILFEINGRKVRFILPLPERDESRRVIAWGAARDSDAHDAEVRRRWRALALVIKAKLEAVASEIVTFEEEFLAHIVIPNGGTFGEWARPHLAQAYAIGVHMPPLLESGGL